MWLAGSVCLDGIAFVRYRWQSGFALLMRLADLVSCAIIDEV
jgi:hypothetical protein